MESQKYLSRLCGGMESTDGGGQNEIASWLDGAGQLHFVSKAVHR
jgi:hypothetical protein